MLSPVNSNSYANRSTPPSVGTQITTAEIVAPTPLIGHYREHVLQSFLSLINHLNTLICQDAEIIIQTDQLAAVPVIKATRLVMKLKKQTGQTRRMRSRAAQATRGEKKARVVILKARKEVPKHSKVTYNVF